VITHKLHDKITILSCNLSLQFYYITYRYAASTILKMSLPEMTIQTAENQNNQQPCIANGHTMFIYSYFYIKKKKDYLYR